MNKKLTKTHLKEFMEKFDVDGDGKISKEEFLKFLRNFMWNVLLIFMTVFYYISLRLYSIPINNYFKCNKCAINIKSNAKWC